MTRLTRLLLGAVLLLGMAGPSWALENSGYGTTTAPTLREGQAAPLSFDLSNYLRVTGTGVGGATLSGCTATAAAPTYTEAASEPVSCDLAGNTRVTLETLISGEDQTHNLLMTSGGAVRGSVGNVASGLLVGADCTSHCTPAAYVALPKGSKTFTSTVVSSTSGATTVAQVHKIYGANTNTFTDDDAVLLCTVTFTSATQYLLKAFTAACAPVTADFLFYGVISSGTTGTGTVTGAVTATY